MSDEIQARPQNPTDAERVSSPQPDAVISQLEQALAQERDRSAKLSLAVKDLRHKAEILDKSYGKQLADTRERCRLAEAERDELAGRVVELEKSLAAPRHAPSAGWQSERVGDEPGFEAPEGTINALLDDGFWLERRAAGEIPGVPVDDLPEPVAEEPGGDMLDPDLIFAKKSGTD